MSHSHWLTLALTYLAAAVIFVPLARRLGLGAIIGYLVAGFAIGPWGLRVVTDPSQIVDLAEFGVVLMLFLIGTFGLNFPIFVSTMAVGVFHVGATGYGLLSSIMAIGTVTGALLAAGRESPATLRALGAWLRFVRGDDGTVDDPLAAPLARLWHDAGREGIVDAVFGERGLLIPYGPLAPAERAVLRGIVAED